jgi:hypothetical protein
MTKEAATRTATTGNDSHKNDSEGTIAIVRTTRRAKERPRGAGTFGKTTFGKTTFGKTTNQHDHHNWHDAVSHDHDIWQEYYQP